jgi:predicted alpha/beta hydrolase
MADRKLNGGPREESARLMRQWCHWNLRRSFVGKDGMDYPSSLAQVRIPVLALAGSADRVIAPWRAAKPLPGPSEGLMWSFCYAARPQALRRTTATVGC